MLKLIANAVYMLRKPRICLHSSDSQRLKGTCLDRYRPQLYDDVSS